jgi:hypothetical protein
LSPGAYLPRPDLQLGTCLKALTVHCLDEYVITARLPLTATYERFSPAFYAARGKRRKEETNKHIFHRGKYERKRIAQISCQKYVCAKREVASLKSDVIKILLFTGFFFASFNSDIWMEQVNFNCPLKSRYH